MSPAPAADVANFGVEVEIDEDQAIVYFDKSLPRGPKDAGRCISILVSIYNSMSDRRHEIAVIRALGASRWQVFGIILLESTILSLGGGTMGWLGAHALNALFSPAIADMTGVTIGFLTIAPPIDLSEFLGIEREISIWPEILLVPGLVLLACLVGFLPALSAYRTDVAKSLGV